MQPAELIRDGVSAELDRILSSPGFSRSERLCKFLRFVIDQRIQGKDSQLKETVLGCEIFGRKADYDPRHDPVVRMEAAKLRARLAEYYVSVGANDPLRIEIPKGTYVPRWHINGMRRRRASWTLAVAAMVALCLVTTGFLVWRRANSAAEASRAAEALALYLKGRTILEDRGRASQALQYFEEVLDLSPNYGPAYAASADALLRMDNDHLMEHQQAMARAESAAHKALGLEPELAEAYVALAVVRVRQYQWKEAERMFRRAIELQPNSVEAHAQFGMWLLLPERRWDEAIAELRRAVALDPLSQHKITWLAYGLLWAGRYAEAEEQSRKAIALNPPTGEAYTIAGQALYWRQNYADGLSLLQEAYQHDASGSSDAWLGCGLVHARHREEALRILKDNLPGGRRKSVPKRRLFALFACLGDKERAFEQLDKMFAENEPLLPPFLLYRELDWLRADPRFGAMLTKIGLAGY
jgi:tetratricopeptide (TPR) repeat protein